MYQLSSITVLMSRFIPRLCTCYRKPVKTFNLIKPKKTFKKTLNLATIEKILAKT